MCIYTNGYMDVPSPLLHFVQFPHTTCLPEYNVLCNYDVVCFETFGGVVSKQMGSTIEPYTIKPMGFPIADISYNNLLISVLRL